MKMKTARQLNLNPEEYEALLLVREGLANGKWKHALKGDKDIACGFNMAQAHYEKEGCGTVACIGGWMAVAMGMDNMAANAYVGKHEPWSGRSSDRPIARLFFPPWSSTYENITTEQAVQAIDNFLKEGSPCWADVIRV